jgi:hypothetical protein
MARLQVDVPDVDVARFKAACQADGRSMSKVVTRLIQGYSEGLDPFAQASWSRPKLEHISVQREPGAPGWLSSPLAKEALASARLDGETQSVAIEDDDGEDDPFGIATANLKQAQADKERLEMEAEVARSHSRPAPKPVAAKRRARG